MKICNSCYTSINPVTESEVIRVNDFLEYAYSILKDDDFIQYAIEYLLNDADFIQYVINQIDAD